MKTMIKITRLIVVSSFLYSSTIFAYNAGNVEEKCKIPKFRNYAPAPKTVNTPVPEVDAGAEIGFWVSGYADQSTIKAIARGQKLKLNIENKQPFFMVTAKLPNELAGKFARINLWAKNRAGDCYGKDGWLIKVRKRSSQELPTD